MPNRIDVSGISPTYDIDTNGDEILTLIKTYIPGLVGRYYGYEHMGRTDLNYPAVFVEPMSANFEMITTGKYRLLIGYVIEWHVIAARGSDSITLATSIGDSLKKLFSNNALADGTTRHKSNPGFWDNSEMQSIEIGRSIRSGSHQSNAVRYMRAGRMRFQTEQEGVIA